MKKERNTLRVLVVDDAEPIRRRLAQMLEEVPGVEVVGEAATVQDALGAIHTLRPDVVTLDLSLAGDSGLDVLRRTRGASCRPLFIVLTINTLAAYREEAGRHGAYAFLDKARECDKAVELIRSLAEMKGRWRLESTREA